jgi:hypothetical protein
VMKVAHQGVPVAALPGTGMIFAAPNIVTPSIASPAIPSPNTPSPNIASPSIANPSIPPAPSAPPPPSALPPAASSAPLTASGPVPPAPIGGRAPPQQPPGSHGIDGWLVDRLFGRR